MNLLKLKTIKIRLPIKVLTLFVGMAICSVTSLAESVVKPLDTAWVSRFERAEWVAMVRIEGVSSLVNQALSAESGMLAVQGYSYNLSVKHQWKANDESASTKLRVDLSDCPILLTLDSEYLVFAKRNYRGQLQLESCDHVVHASEAGTVISWLNNSNTPQVSAPLPQ